MAKLPQIPGRRFRLRGRDPEFVHAPEFGESWFVLGTAARVRSGCHCRVRRWTENDYVTVVIDQVIAERTVEHQPGSHYGLGTVRYVLATIDKSGGREVGPSAGERRADAVSQSRVEWLKRSLDKPR